MTSSTVFLIIADRNISSTNVEGERREAECRLNIDHLLEELRACAQVMAYIYKRSVFIFRTHARRGFSALLCSCVFCCCICVKQFVYMGTSYDRVKDRRTDR